MDRIDLIINNDKYKEYYAKILEAEATRIYCRHDMVHFLDVARIALILSYEEEIDVSKEYIYAAALLHDIGRFVQYRDNTPHELASAELAVDILKESGFSMDEIEDITCAIREHGNSEVMMCRDLKGIVYRGDKLSRKCFLCDACDTCHKDVNKRNLTIKY